ncbi:hypothetical protein BU16DRAFT_537993 [Lophium mytilinum]|uniref:Uncharacterized protein n=1 Tax=Lophium mytilinum TaxID=390894 RepID=A0A6A6QYK1_9PEZI|nr:hypothetical protein BU16DRAFT_537993 [Lophium mytilinum]
MLNGKPSKKQSQPPHGPDESFPSFPMSHVGRYEFEDSLAASDATRASPAPCSNPYAISGPTSGLHPAFAIEENVMLSVGRLDDYAQYATVDQASRSVALLVDQTRHFQESASLEVAAKTPNMTPHLTTSYSDPFSHAMSDNEWNYDDEAVNLNKFLEESATDALERANICLKAFAENKAIEISNVVRATRITPALNRALQKAHENLGFLASVQTDNDDYSQNNSSGSTAAETDQICSADTARLRRNCPRVLAGRGAPDDPTLPQTDDTRKADVRRIRDSMLNTIGVVDVGKHGVKHWMDKKYTSSDVEAWAWLVQETFEAFHVDGYCYPKYTFSTSGVNPDPELSYAERINTVCDMLARRKYYCTYVVNGDMIRIWWLAGNPKHVEARDPGNMRGNEKKRGFTKAGRELAEKKGTLMNQEAEAEDDTSTHPPTLLSNLTPTITPIVAAATRRSNRNLTVKRKRGQSEQGEEDEDHREMATNTGRNKRKASTRSATRLVSMAETAED